MVIMAFVFGITISNTIRKEAGVIGTLRASGYTRQELILHYKMCIRDSSISEKKLVGAVTEAILHYISVLVELKEILAYVKTASIPRQRLLEEDKKLEMLEKESQRILNIKVCLLYTSRCV